MLRVAEATGFHVLPTTDNNITYQQNLQERKIAIVVRSRNRWRLVQRMILKIVAAVNTAVNNAKPGSYTLIEVPSR